MEEYTISAATPRRPSRYAVGEIRLLPVDRLLAGALYRSTSGGEDLCFRFRRLARELHILTMKDGRKKTRIDPVARNTSNVKACLATR